MPCEMCGRQTGGCRLAMIDGVKMMLCPDCIKYGEGIKTVERVPPPTKRYTPVPTIRRKEKDIFKKMDKKLVSDWPDKIKEARKKKGFSREELGFKINERTVTISKFENGDLRPSDRIVKKLEKELDISLTEEAIEVSTQDIRRYSSGNGMSLGDFIKTED